MNPIDISELPLERKGLEQLDLPNLLYPLWINRLLIGSITFVFLIMGILFVCFKIPLYSSNILLQLEEKHSLLDIGKSPLNSMMSNNISGAEIQTALIMSRYILEPVIQQLKLNLSVTPAYFPVIGKWYAQKHKKQLKTPWWGSERFAWGGENLQVAQFVVPQILENKPFTVKITDKNHYALYDDQDHVILESAVGHIATTRILNGDEITIQISAIKGQIGARFYVIKKSFQVVIDQLLNQLKIVDLSQELKLGHNTGILKITLVDPRPEFVVQVLNEIAHTVNQKNIEKKLKEAKKTLTFIKAVLPKAKASLDEAENKLNNYFAREGILDLRSQSKLLIDQIAYTQRRINQFHLNENIMRLKYTPHHPFYIAFQEKEKILRAKLKSLQLTASQLPMRDQTAIRLMRDISVKTQLYLLLLKKIQTLEMIRGGAVGDITVLGFASFPIILPKGSLSILSFSFLLGLVFSSLLIYIRLLLNQRISDPTVIEKQFGLINMAIIPFSHTQRKMLTAHQHQNLLPLLAKTHPQDLSIEALRSLRTSLKFSMLNAANNRIMISGISSGVGKSFISVNFAYLLADSGKKVLLIDGDLRKGYLKDYFFIQSRKGLTEIICGSAQFENVLFADLSSSLHFLHTGSLPPNPSELLMSRSFQEFLQNISQRYDLIVIDTPPILPVTDAAIIAQYTAANFLVLGSNLHTGSEIELALKRFQANGIKMNGAIFNFSKPQKYFYQTSSVYQYQYQYQ